MYRILQSIHLNRIQSRRVRGSHLQPVDPDTLRAPDSERALVASMTLAWTSTAARSAGLRVAAGTRAANRSGSGARYRGAMAARATARDGRSDMDKPG